MRILFHLQNQSVCDTRTICPTLVPRERRKTKPWFKWNVAWSTFLVRRYNTSIAAYKYVAFALMTRSLQHMRMVPWFPFPWIDRGWRQASIPSPYLWHRRSLDLFPSQLYLPMRRYEDVSGWWRRSATRKRIIHLVRSITHWENVGCLAAASFSSATPTFLCVDVSRASNPYRAQPHSVRELKGA